MNAAEPDLQPVVLNQPSAPEMPRLERTETSSPELIRLTPHSTFSALVREIASRSAH